MGLITKGELVRATMTWKQAHFSVVMFRSLQLPHKGARGTGVPPMGSLPLQSTTLLFPRNSAWMIFRVMSLPHGGSQFLCLGPSILMAIQTSDGTVCRPTCLLSQHGAPSFPLPLYQPQHMESYTQSPPECQSV